MQSILLHGCRPADTAYGKGLVASASLNHIGHGTPTSAEIIRVPRHLVITDQLALELSQSNPLLHLLLHVDEEGQDIADDEDLAALMSPKQIIARFLLFQILCAKSPAHHTIFSPWILSLPSKADLDLPYAWDPEDIGELQGTSIYEATLAKAQFLRFRFDLMLENERLVAAVSQFVQEGLEAGHSNLSRQPDDQGGLDTLVPSLGSALDAADASKQGLTFDDFITVEQWISSRALSIPAKHDMGMAMVPTIDLCNHGGPDANALYELDEKTGEVVLLTKPGVALSEGMEITIDYGSRGAAEFMFNYGFIPQYLVSAQKASFYYPVLDDRTRECIDPAATANGDQAELYDLMAKFYERPQSRLIVVEPSEPGQPFWHCDFLCLYWARDRFELVRTSDYYELHYNGTEVDLEDVQDWLMAKDRRYYDEVVVPRGNESARRLLREFFVLDDTLDDDSAAGRLRRLEQALLRRVS